MSVQVCLKFHDLPVVTFERLLANIENAANISAEALGGGAEASIEIGTVCPEKALDYALVIGRAGWLMDNRGVQDDGSGYIWHMLISKSWDDKIPF